VSKVLFILKRREDFNTVIHNHIGLSTGLYNSAKFVNDMLPNSELVVVVDNNDIDREVTRVKPTHVIIEALWVVPQKFNELQKHHPDVKWIVRLHSEMPFMAGEGIAMDWIAEYARYHNVLIACNAPRMMKEVKVYLDAMGIDANRKVLYLPNFYPQEYKTKPFNKNKEHIDICCFGAVRPLKNHLVQAIAALDFAKKNGKKLRFHVNAGRIEMKGEPLVSNLKSMFAQLYNQGHELINHTWVPREQFLELCAEMDIGLQVSFSETFNIVGADLISQGVPIVGSKEIPWMNYLWYAEPTSGEDICMKLQSVYSMPDENVRSNQEYLANYTNETKKIWLDYFKEN
jgi:hypothetical protein